MTAPVAANPEAKNWIGMAALIAGVLGVSLGGIIFGHLGLNAHKRGEANNRGLSLAGVILGYFGLVAGFGLLFGVIFPALLVQSDRADQAAARADIATAGKEVATWWVDGVEPPEFFHSDGQYSVGTASGGYATWNVSIANPQVDSNIRTASDWCVTIHFDGGTTGVVSYGAASGLTDTVNCSR